MQKAQTWDDVDWGQFAVGDQFTGLAAITMAGSPLNLISVQSQYHPDMELVVKAIVDDMSSNFEDLDIDCDEVDLPDDAGVYECIFELTEVYAGETLNWKVVKIRPTTARLTLTPRQKTDGMTDFDRKKMAAAMGAPVDEPGIIPGLTIQW